jgi:hypothetical protein
MREKVKGTNDFRKEIQETRYSQEYFSLGWGQGGEMTQALYAHMN